MLVCTILEKVKIEDDEIDVCMALREVNIALAGLVFVICCFLKKTSGETQYTQKIDIAQLDLLNT